MKKLMIILAISLTGCGEADMKYTIKVEKCNGRFDTVVYVGTHPTVFGKNLLDNDWRQQAINVCDYKILKVEKP